MVGRRACLVAACSGAALLAGCVSQPGGYGTAGGGYAAPGYAAQGYATQGYGTQGYATQGYGTQGYAPQAQPGVAGYGYPGDAQGYGSPAGGYVAGPPPGQPYVGPDGLTYVDGVPVDEIGGEQVPLVFVVEQGGWGYYDRGRGWHGARPELRERLERSHPEGRGLPPPGGGRGPFGRRDAGGPPQRPGFGGAPEQPDRGRSGDANEAPACLSRRPSRVSMTSTRIQGIPVTAGSTSCWR